MRTVLKRILSTLALLLVAGAQVVGLQRGYECHHQAEATVTSARHCHRAELGFVPCVSESATEAAGHEAHDDHDGDTDPHEPLLLSTAADPSSLLSVSLPLFTATLLAELQVFDRVWVQKCVESPMNQMPLDAGGERPPPAALQVARCMVLLV